MQPVQMVSINYDGVEELTGVTTDQISLTTDKITMVAISIDSLSQHVQNLSKPIPARIEHAARTFIGRVKIADITPKDQWTSQLTLELSLFDVMERPR